ncbi:transmembrane protein 138 [Cryptotermes secundus]|uniref:transmembrane protein 138 n=1 Tax=Cryptotermes secundus TaxID=105785 RepID=UPI000CD7B2B6|nr:transmembrane protein 138 [Cryptotermes secundus]
MKLTISRYCVMLFVQFGLLFVDILVNCFSDFARKSSVVVLLLFIIQDVCLIFALISLVLSFFSTYAFQAGLIELLYDRFRATIIISTAYLILTITLHSWSLSERWGHPLGHIWPSGLIWLYVIQRLLAVLYYYHYKRSMLRISDPRFYEDFGWMKQQHDGS